MNADCDVQRTAIGASHRTAPTGGRASRLQSREVIRTLVALRQRFEAIRRAELIRLEPKLRRLSPEARTRLDEITRLLVERLLLTPTEQLESVSDGPMKVRYADALNRIFKLAAEDAVAPLSVDSETTASNAVSDRGAPESAHTTRSMSFSSESMDA
jgi:Glutamyl-tRNAGlu reductase, dimerisation domain